MDGMRIFGIPIYIDRSWFFVATCVTWSLAHGYFPSLYPTFPPLTYWIMGTVAAFFLFSCVLLHELGHSVVAKGHGIPVARVTLFMFGGVAQIAEEPHRPFTELKIALAGPLVSVAIAALCFWAASIWRVQTLPQVAALAIIRYVAILNTGLLLFNMLPGFPLDGGRLLRAVLWSVTGNLRTATRLASLVGIVLGLCLLAFGVSMLVRGAWFGGVWYLLLGFFLRDAAQTSYRQARN